MLRKISVLLFFLLSAVVLIAQQNVVIRFHNPSSDFLKKFPPSKYDVTSIKPGQYVDIMLPETEFPKLKAQGYQVEITQTPQQMMENLKGTDDIPGYDTYQEVLTKLQTIAAAHPDICKLYTIGQSRGKEYALAGNANYNNYQHDIWALKVSDNVNVEEDEPGIYYFGAHHAREPISTQVSLAVLEHIINNYNVNPTITQNVNNTQIWFVPIVNPDGHKVVLDNLNTDWRKNIRDNNGNGQINVTGWTAADGVDPNRNYAFEWGGQGTSSDPTDLTYCGPSPASEPEVQAIQDLMGDHHFVAGITYHSYSELVLWAYGYATGATAPDNAAYSNLGTLMGNAIPGISGGTYTPQPSWALYPASGITDDYAYGVHGIFSFCVELGTQFIPPASQVPTICNANINAAMLLLDRINKSTLTGHITNALTGEPVEAEIYVQGVDNTGDFRFPYMSDSLFGRYYRMLMPGTFTVTYSAYGYLPQTINGLSINNTSQTIQDVQLQPAQAISVTGLVTDSQTGDPIPGATVQLIGTPIDPVQTNGQGQYEINPVFEGTYTFKVWAQNYATIQQTISVSQLNHVFDFQLTFTTAVSFETGIFPEGFTFGGNQPWTIDATQGYDGTHSARSGQIGNNATSSMQKTVNVTQASSISFFRKVSTEASYDFLEFYIDNVLKDEWSGNQDWDEFSYPVTTGNHTFKWVYTKDVAVTGGSDAVWVDYITFPVSQTQTTANAGPNATICAGLTHTCQGTATNYTTIAWTTSGDGTFSNSAVLTPVYTPGNNDIAAGAVTLTLLATGATSASDNMVLTITSAPQAPETPVGETGLCENSPNTTYTIPNAPGGITYGWFLTPTYAGTMNTSNNSVTIDWDEVFTGTATLSAVAGNNCGSSSPSPLLLINVEALPAAAETITGEEYVCTWPGMQGPYFNFNVPEIYDATSYEWILTPADCGIMTLNGNSVSVSFQGQYLFTYGSLKVRGLNDCGAGQFSDEFTFFIDICEGIDDLNTRNIQIHPNPVNDILNVSFQSQAKETILSVYNVFGRRIIEQHLISQPGMMDIPVDVKALPNGTYYLVIQSGNERGSSKFVILK